MRFALLGPLRIRVPGERPVPRGDRHLRLLAMLLLAEDRPVPAETLQRGIWGETVPRAADELIARMLRDWQEWLPGDRVCEFDRIGSSHRLRVRPDELDVHRFRRLVAEAREHVEGGTDDRAVAVWDRALELWRGRPLEGLSGTGFDDGVARILEFKAEVDEERFAALIRLGRHEVAVREALQAILDRPLDQDATRRLMVALVESGRDSEATQAYEQLEAVLDERSGHRPRRELQELAERIKEGDRALPESVRTYEPDLPRQLPPPVLDFTGRNDPLARLDASRERRAPGVVISGIGGLGKTSLGLEWAHRNSDAFPDGQLYADLRGASLGRPAEPLAILHGFMRALGFDPAALPDDLDQAGADFRTYAAGRRVLVFLDNAFDADQVRPLLPGAGTGFTIVTSRNRMPGLDALGAVDALELSEMDAAESTELLLRLSGAELPDAVEELVEHCGGLPLALRIASDLLGDLALPQLVSQLASRPLERIRIPGEPLADLRSVFDLSYRHLGDAERRLHLMLAPLPGRDFGEDLALALARRLDDDPRRPLEGLVRSHWLRPVSQGRYEAHNLVAAYAEEKAEQELTASERQLVRDRVVAHFHLLGAAIPLEEYEFLTAAYEAWWKYPNASRLASALCAFAQRGHRLAELVRLGERGAAASAGLGPVDQARHCNLVAVAAYAQGDLEKAVEYGRKSIAALESTENGDRVGTARANLGGALARLGRFDEALPVLEAALAAAEASGAWDGAVTTSLALAHVHRGLGDAAAAKARLQGALDVDRDRSGGLRANVIRAHLDELRRHHPHGAAS